MKKDSKFRLYKLASLDLNDYLTCSGQQLLNQQILNTIMFFAPASDRIAKKLTPNQCPGGAA